VDEIVNRFALPLRGGVELGEAEAGEGFAFAGEELLHEPLFVGLERVEFLAFGSDQLVQRAQALGDFLLLVGQRRRDSNIEERIPANVQESVATGTARDVSFELNPVSVLLEAALEKAVRVALLEAKAYEDVGRSDFSPSSELIDTPLWETQRVAFVENEVAVTHDGVELVLTARDIPTELLGLRNETEAG
jgi:hypothetical protein